MQDSKSRLKSRDQQRAILISGMPVSADSQTKKISLKTPTRWQKFGNLPMVLVLSLRFGQSFSRKYAPKSSARRALCCLAYCLG